MNTDSSFTAVMPPKTAQPPPQHPPQFSLRALLATTTGLCVLFALLRTLGVHPGAALVAFVVISSIAGLQILLIELLGSLSRQVDKEVY